MSRHKHYGFTVVELLVVIVVIAILVTVTGLSYRAVQNNAKDESTKVNAAALSSAIDEYYAKNGIYYWPTDAPLTNKAGTCAATSVHCVVHVDESGFQGLVDGGYIKSIPRRGDGVRFRYVVSRPNNVNGFAYAIEVIFIGKSSCKIGKNMNSTWWAGAPTCSF